MMIQSKTNNHSSLILNHLPKAPSRPIRSLPTYQVGPCNPCNPWLINDLRLYMALYNCKDTFTDVMKTLQIKLFMQNKANFQKVKLNVNKVLTRDYDEMDTWSIRTKQSQTNPNKAKLKKAKMIVTSYITKAYENKSPIRAPKKQSQTSKRQKLMQTSLLQRIMKKPPLWAPKKQSQFKPKQTQCLPAIYVVVGQKPKIQWFAKFTPSLDVKKFHLMLVLHRRILFNSASNCEIDMAVAFANEGKTAARQANKLTFWDPLETLTRLR